MPNSYLPFSNLLATRPSRKTATAQDWKKWVGGLSRYQRDQLYPGMHKDLIADYEMVEAEEERKVAHFGPFGQNGGTNFDPNFNKPYQPYQPYEPYKPFTPAPAYQTPPPKPAQPSYSTDPAGFTGPAGLAKPDPVLASILARQPGYQQPPASQDKPARVSPFGSFNSDSLFGPSNKTFGTQASFPARDTAPPLAPTTNPVPLAPAFAGTTSSPPPGYRPMGLLDLSYTGTINAAPRQATPQLEGNVPNQHQGSTFNGQTANAGPTEPNSIENAGVQMNSANASRTNTGTLFDTPEQAARNAVRDINPRSIRENREYGGTIERSLVLDKKADGTSDFKLMYSATPPLQRGVDGGALDFRFDRTVGMYHTHADYSEINEDGTKTRIDTSLPQAERRKLDRFDSHKFSGKDNIAAWEIKRATAQYRKKYGDLERMVVSCLGMPDGSDKCKYY